MAQRTISNSPKLAKAIRSRRIDLGLTIEEAAEKAGVGTKTWSRYEAGEAIRQDKSKGICKALNWFAFPSQEAPDDNKFRLEEYMCHKAYSSFLAEAFGPLAAVSFAIGSDILLHHLEEDLHELSSKPRNTHIGELSCSWLKDSLPPQFLTCYDYEFLYYFRARVLLLRELAHKDKPIIAHSVIDELALYLFMEKSSILMEFFDYTDTEFQDGKSTWNDWPFDLFDDSDVLILYSDIYVPEGHCYHYSQWLRDQFNMG